MANNQFFAPTLAPDLLKKQYQLQNNQMLAQQLMQTQQPQGQSVSGHYVAPHWTQQLAAALSPVVGQQIMRKMPEQMAELQQAQQDRTAQMFGFNPTPQQLAQGLSGGAQAFPVSDSGGPPANQPMLMPGFNEQQSRTILENMGPEAYAAALARGSLGSQQTFAPQQSTSGFFQVGPSGVQILTDPNTGKPLMPVTADAGTAGAVAQARAFGTETGKTDAQNQASAPQELANMQQMLDTIDAVANHPGLDVAVGSVQGRLPALTEKGADFTAKLAQLQGQTFLQAFQSLKGGGQITEIEGQKAEAAIASLTRAQSEKQFKEALETLKGVVTGAMDRIRNRGGVQSQAQTSAPAGMPRVQSPADLESLPSGAVFIAPDGSQRRKP